MEGALSHINLCLASLLFYPDYAGGALRFLRYSSGFAIRHVNTSVFCGTSSVEGIETSKTGANWNKYRYGEAMSKELVNGIPVYRVKLPATGTRKRSIVYYQKLVQFCQQAKYRPDVIQAFGLSLWAIPWLLKIRRLGIPTLSVYTLIEDWSTNSVIQNLQKLHWKFPSRLVDCVVVNSKLMQEELFNLGVTGRIEVIPNGVDISRFNQEKKLEIRHNIRQSFDIGDKELVLITVGSVEPRKGIDLLLEGWCQLASRYSECHLFIIGPRTDLIDPGFKSFHQTLEGLVTASGASNRVHFIGRVENVEDYLKAGDVFVFSSQREGLPNVVLEAMATGLPVVMTPFAGLSDELGKVDKHYLLVEKRDPILLATLIERVLTQTELRTKVGLAARKWVEETMDVEKSIDQYANLYHELAYYSKTRK